MSKFISDKRKIINELMNLDNIVQVANKKPKIINPILPEGFHFNEASITDSKAIASIYQKVFDSYPFPIYEEEYIVKTINSNVRYFIVQKEDRIASISSTEMDISNKNVEMTDFATLPSYRGLGLARYLLYKMEQTLNAEDFHVAYSIARAKSLGMNIVFGSMNYNYGGRLLNNTQISGNIESMNIWYKNFNYIKKV
jgi:putative beta-lysine N-acetyltransferase